MGDHLKIIRESILTTLDEDGLKPASIFLFGSRARKKHSELSDYDLLVIVKDELDPHTKRKVRRKIYNKLHDTLPVVSFDIIVKTEKEFRTEKEVVNTISNEALLEGIRI